MGDFYTDIVNREVYIIFDRLNEPGRRILCPAKRWVLW